MGSGPLRLAALVVALACLPPAEARADWLVIPFFGGTFHGGTTLVEDLEQGATASHFLFGGSVGWLSREHIFGAEAEFSHAPHFFERENSGDLVVGSDVTTMTVSIVAAVPLSVTRESLRPYLVGGGGLMHAGISDLSGRLTIGENVLGMSLGGGAIGFITPRTGVRFDLRHFRTVNGPEETLIGARRNHLSFWRASFGVTLRY